MAKSYIAVIKEIQNASEDVERFYEPIIDLIEEYPWGVSLAYAFSQLETGQKNVLYCGMRKIHGVHSDVAWAAIGSEHLTRNEYRERFKNVIGVHIPQDMIDSITTAEKTRDSHMHGGHPKVHDMRKAIVSVFKYSEDMNTLCKDKHKFSPYGSLRGFTGSGTSLSKATSRLVAKGLGFNLS